MRKQLGLILVTAILAGVNASASDGGPVWVHNGFFTGEQFLKLSVDAKVNYASGLIDGVLLGPLFGAPKAKLEWLEACLVDMTNSQVSAILEKFLKENPSRWHQGAHTSMFAAFRASCPTTKSNG